jgi:hypothetical protein
MFSHTGFVYSRETASLYLSALYRPVFQLEMLYRKWWGWWFGLLQGCAGSASPLNVFHEDRCGTLPQKKDKVNAWTQSVLKRLSNKTFLADHF